MAGLRRNWNVFGKKLTDSLLLLHITSCFFLGRRVNPNRVSLCCTGGPAEATRGGYRPDNVLLLGLLMNHLIIGWWELSHEKEIHSYKYTLYITNSWCNCVFGTCWTCWHISLLKKDIPGLLTLCLKCPNWKFTPFVILNHDLSEKSHSLPDKHSLPGINPEFLQTSQPELEVVVEEVKSQKFLRTSGYWPEALLRRWWSLAVWKTINKNSVISA